MKNTTSKSASVMGMSCETHRVSQMQMLTKMFACKLETGAWSTWQER